MLIEIGSFKIVASKVPRKARAILFRKLLACDSAASNGRGASVRRHSGAPKFFSPSQCLPVLFMRSGRVNLIGPRASERASHALVSLVPIQERACRKS